MTAGIFARAGVLEIQERLVPQLSAADEVLLKVEATGVCGTDLHVLSDPHGHPATQGAILGHEIIAHVAEVGKEVTQFSVGERVVVDPNLKCGLCRPCRRGLQNHCLNWTTIGIFQDGGFARYVAVPQRALHPIPESIALKDAVWTELLSCVIGSTDRVAIQPGQTALVIGAGPAGMLHALMFKAAGARVLIADIAPFRLNLAQKAGVETVNVSATDLREVVMSTTDDWGADVVVDAVGTQITSALELVATGGAIALFGMNAHAKQELSQNLITRKELNVFGSFVGYHVFPRAIEVLASGVIRPGQLTTHSLGLEDLPKGIAAAHQGEAMKVMVQP